MRAVIQRVTEASVTIDSSIVSSIKEGLLVFLGIEEADSDDDSEWLAKKIVNLRIFDDSTGVMNLSVKESGGDILMVSQFTLHAKTKKGNRPSYIKSAAPDLAIPIYNRFFELLENELERSISTGKFGAEMEVALVNSGPVTILIDTKKRE